MMEVGPAGLFAEVAADLDNALVSDEPWCSFRKPIDFFDRLDENPFLPVPDLFRCNDDRAGAKASRTP